MMTEIEKYIQQILVLVYSKDDLDQILFDLSLFMEHIGYNTVVKSGGDEIEKRKTLVDTEIPNIESPILKDYFSSLTKANDLWLFDPGHFKLFIDELHRAADETVLFNLTTAIELKPEDLRGLSEKLSKKIQRKVVVHMEVEKNLLAGAVIKKGNFILDYSLKTRLNNLSSQWKKSIQKAS